MSWFTCSCQEHLCETCLPDVSILAFDIGLGKLKRQVLPIFLHELELECFLSCVTSAWSAGDSSSKGILQEI